MTQSTDLKWILVDKTANLRNGKLIGIVTAQPETAPLPPQLPPIHHGNLKYLD
jgi:hypothetical protein